MSDSARFAVAVTCIDGRIQAAVAEAVRRTHGVTHVDMVTVPGGEGALVGRGQGREHVRAGVEVSATAHQSAIALVAGHTDCAGHPVDAETHAADIGEAAEWLRREFPHLIVLTGLVDTATGALRPV